MFGQLSTIVIGVALTIISGIADSQGFLHASNVWSGDRLNGPEVTKSALGFAIGVGTYWIALRYLTRAGIVAPEVQTAVWFGVAIISVAVISRQFLVWRLSDQIVALTVITGIGWLSFRTGH